MSLSIVKGYYAYSNRLPVPKELVFVAVFLLSRKLVHLRESTMREHGIEPTISRFLADVSSWASAYLTLAALASRMLGFQVGLSDRLSSLSLAVAGFASQKMVGNFVAGLFLIFTRPFNVGDRIVCAGIEGWVLEIGVFHTYLNTPNHERLLVPNTKLFENDVLNKTFMEAVRAEVQVSVARELDIHRVRAVLQRAVEEVATQTRARIGNRLRLAGLPNKRGHVDGNSNTNPDKGRPLASLVPSTSRSRPQVLLTSSTETAVIFNLRVWCSSPDAAITRDAMITAASAGLAEANMHAPRQLVVL